MRRTTWIVALAMTALVLGALPATAHVTANPNEAHSPFFRTSFRVGHGCDGSPTVVVRVQIPEQVITARAQPVPGWDIEVVRETLDEPIEGEEEPITERVTEIAWTGGELPDEHFQEFGVSIRIGDGAPDVLYFPVVQECAEGAHRWIEIPDTVEQWNDLDEPAPYVRVAFGGEAADEPDPEQDAQDEPLAAEPVADTGTGPVTWIALVLAIIGVALGGAALTRAKGTTS